MLRFKRDILFGMQSFDSHHDDDDSVRGVPWKPALLLWAALFLYLPLGALLGLCSFSEWRFSLSLPFAMVLFFIGSGFVVFWPLSHLVMPSLPTVSLPAARVALLAGLACPPLFAFACYRGGYRDLMDAHEAFLAVVPPAVLASWLWEHTRRASWFVGFIVSALMISFFLVNDVLSGYETLTSYLSSSGGFYVLRSAVPMAVLIGGTLWLAKAPSERTTRMRNVSIGCFAVACYGLVALGIVPATAALQEGASLWARVDWVLWPGLFIVGALMWMGERVNRWLPWVTGLESLLFALQLLAELRHSDSSYTGLARLCFLMLACSTAIRALVVSWPRARG